ncbi:MAG: hypothetical protein KDK91_04505, partial [Gammaproteobacteria bacterium]|nr:hypothetical protein [Gammaproteobacteria bacterium]
MNAVRFIQRETPVRAGRSGCTRLSRSLSALGRSLLYGTPLAAALFAGSASAEKVLRVGMTAADIPINIGQPDQGFEGFRFMGYMLYDTLVLWDLSKADAPAGLMPGLAESWSIDPENDKRWIFKLRKGVKFHDGAAFNADDVVFSLNRAMEKTSNYGVFTQGIDKVV